MAYLPRATRRLLLPILAGILVCLMWTHFHVHLGLQSRVVTASHHRLPATGGVESLALLFASAAAAAAAARAGVTDALGRVPASAIPWGGGRPITREDLLAGAAFGAYRANPTAAVHGQAIAYRRAGPMLVVLGGPAGDPQRAHLAQAEFRRWAGRRPIVWYGAGSKAGNGLHLGKEAIVQLARHDPASPRTANLRHSIARARRAGVEVLHGSWAQLPAAVHSQLRVLERQWRRRHPIRLRLTLSSLRDATDGRLWGVCTRQGRVEAAVTWLDSADGNGAVLDLMRRRQDAVPGAMELLIHEGLIRARENGRTWASLGVVGDHAPEGLRRFKAKFRPEWHDRYVAAPGIPLPLALAAAAWAHLAPWRSS
jgi:lysylphosphatidylglycerol synthetase-like protein (DUF2156 family)